MLRRQNSFTCGGLCCDFSRVDPVIGEGRSRDEEVMDEQILALSLPHRVTASCLLRYLFVGSFILEESQTQYKHIEKGIGFEKCTREKGVDRTLR